MAFRSISPRSPIPSGRRTQRVTVQGPNLGSPPSQPDGDFVEDWQDLSPAWAVAIEPADQRTEYAVSGTSMDSATHIVTGPYRADVTLRTRLLLDGARALNIVSRIDPQERHRELILICREVV